jgi:hypothetical protein
MFQMLGVFAEFEQAMIVCRVTAGLKRARANGKTLGRPKIDRVTDASFRKALAKGDKDILKIAAKFRLGSGTVQRIKAEMAAEADKAILRHRAGEPRRARTLDELGDQFSGTADAGYVNVQSRTAQSRRPSARSTSTHQHRANWTQRRPAAEAPRGAGVTPRALSNADRVSRCENIQSRYRLGFFSLDEEPVVIKCPTPAVR